MEAANRLREQIPPEEPNPCQNAAGRERDADLKQFEYAPAWFEGVTDEELLHELSRRLAYKEHGWQESHASAQYWRERATEVDSNGR